MSISKLLNPNSIAVIGASSNKNKLGWQILNNLVSGGYKGKVYPVNLKEKTIEGIKAYKNIKDITNKVDLVVIVIPAQAALNVLKECGDKGIKDVIVISAGFSEEKDKGEQREQTLIKIANRYKMNVLGPNCLGLINNISGLNATFANDEGQELTKDNNIACISQSGALGSAMLDWSVTKNLGLSYFISLGNEAVLDENDFLEYLQNDKKTNAVALYLEEIVHGHLFMEKVSKMSLSKPVIVLKSGVTDSGKKASISHTGSLAGSKQATETGLARSGAIEADSLKDFFDLIRFFNQKNVSRVGDIFIVSNAGGPLVAAVDELEKNDLELGEYTPKTKRVLQEKIKGITSNIDNPIDIIGDADADRYETVLQEVLKDKNVGSILVILTPQTATQPIETAKKILKLKQNYKNKLILTSFIGGEKLQDAKNILHHGSVLDFDYPTEALYCLGKSKQYTNKIKKLKVYSGQKDKTKADKSGQMDYIESFSLLERFSIPSIETKIIKSIKDIKNISFPTVFKAVGPEIVHKTDKNSLVLDIENKKQAERAFDSLSSFLEISDNYCVAQPMIKQGVEMIVGFKRDVSFGPILLVGAGGIYTEVLKDIQTEVDDINLSRAMVSIKQLKIFPLLTGARGGIGYDVKGLAKTLVNLSKLAKLHPDISEVDINPLFVTKEGVVAVDPRIIY